MKIVVIQETDWIRRGPHQQHHLFERLSLRGHTITVLDYPILREHWPQESFFVPTLDRTNVARIYDNASIRLSTPWTVSFGPLARPSSVLSHHSALHDIIRIDRPDLIVSYALSTGMPALRLARRYGIPYVFHVIDALHAIVPSKALQPVAHAFERRILHAADEVIVINEHLRDYVISMGAPPARAEVLRTGVDLTRFKPTSGDSVSTRLGLGIRPDDFVLFFMGWIYDFSGVLTVAETLRDAPPGVKLLVVGDGDQYEELKTLRDTELKERLILTGRVSYDRIPALLSAANVALLPFETVPATEHIVPIKLYEYMAAGIPVVAAPLPGVQRDVGRENGVIYAPAEGQINVALGLRSHADELGRKARAFVQTYCNWDTITDEFEARLIAHIEGPA